MKVILTNDVKGTGKKGDTLEVKESYARNVLIKKGLAVEASNQNLNELKNKQSSDQHKLDLEKAANEEIAEKIKDKEVAFAVKAGQGGKLFGSVTPAHIADEINKIFGVNINKKNVVLKSEIKNFGDYTATIKMSQGVSCTVKIKVSEG